jgi:hypothetical protein
MIFYGEVVVLADHVILKQLLNELGPDTLGTLVEEDFLRLHYLPDSLALLNDQAPSVFTPIRLGLSEGVETRIKIQLKQKLGSAIKAERKTARIARHLHRVVTSDVVEKGFIASVTSRPRLDPAIRVILQSLLQTDSPPQFRFEVNPYGRGVHVSTDLNFEVLNSAYHKHVDPKKGSLTAPLLLSHYLNAQEESYFSAQYGAEIASDPLYQKLTQLDLAGAISARMKSQTEIAFFTDYNFHDGRDVKAAINSGARTVDEFLPVLAQARKFRDWAGSLAENASLMKEYYRALSVQTWLDKLPGKTTRWSVFTGAGLALDSLGLGGIGTLGGISLSALDSFFLDRLVKGWRPNQFVDRLQDFVGHN